MFLKQEIEKYKSEPRRINIYVATIRTHFNEKFEDTLLFFLSINPDVEVFEKIDWVGNVGVMHGDVNFGEIYAKRWNYILKIVNKATNSLSIIPIKTYLRKKIASNYKWAESERKRKFLIPDW